MSIIKKYLERNTVFKKETLMNNLKPLTLENAPEASKPLIEGIQKTYGFVPNLMATFANSPAVLEGYLAMDAAWSKSSLSPSERQLILLTVSVQNACGYCTAAHSTILKQMMKVDPETVRAIREKRTTGNAKQDALVGFVMELVSERGHVSGSTKKRFFFFFYTPVHMMEVLIGLALKTVSNTLDHLNPVELDAGFKAEA